MRRLRKIFALFLTVVVVFSMHSNVVFAAETQEPTLLEPTSIDMINSLDEASNMLGEGIINEEEYVSMLLDIYQLNNTDLGLLSNVRASDYYPEVQAGYINYEGVKYLYEEGLRNAETIEAICAVLIGMSPQAGWGISAISVVAAYGSKSSLEKAVNQAYFAGKGIKVYYQIHVSIQSLNKVRYVVA